jgi:hypothetical protein
MMVNEAAPILQRSSRLVPSIQTHGDSTIVKAPKGTGSIEQFFWANLSGDNDFCLANLEMLSQGKEVPREIEQKLQLESQRLLRNRCVSLFNFYGNVGFMTLFSEALEALENYGGKQDPFSLAFMFEQLRHFGFVLTPRMWSRLEIVLIMVLLLDPNLDYLHVNQKKQNLDEATQNR